jgi:hypothetical protein
VIRGDEQDSPEAASTDLGDPPDRQVDRFHGDACGSEVGGVADHVSPGQVHPDEAELTAAHRVDRDVGGLGGLHPRALVERDEIGGNLDVGLEFDRRTCSSGCRSRSR